MASAVARPRTTPSGPMILSHLLWGCPLLGVLPLGGDTIDGDMLVAEPGLRPCRSSRRRVASPPLNATVGGCLDNGHHRY